MNNDIRKYHISWKEVIYRPEAVYSNLNDAVRVLKEKYAEQRKMYGTGHYAQSLEQAMLLVADVYTSEENLRKGFRLKRDYIWNGSFHGIEGLDKAVEEYKTKNHLEGK